MAGKERESKKFRGEIPGIEWPTEILTPIAINSIIEASKSKPLRTLIAQQIILEASRLWEKIQIGYPNPPDSRTPQDIAVREGFMGTGNTILKAEAYFLDREGNVQRLNNAVKLFKILAKTELITESRMDSHKRDALRIRMKETVKSLNIDPTGLNLLKKTLNGKTSIYGDNDPEVIGLIKGKMRYKQLYIQTVAAGAIQDKNSLIQKVKARLTIIPQ